jgi:hypothetical protein
MMEDKKTINLMDRAFNNKKANPSRSATILIKPKPTKPIEK